MCTYSITPIAKWLCDTPLVILTLKFHDLHPFLIYTPTPSVYAHPIFNCVPEAVTGMHHFGLESQNFEKPTLSVGYLLLYSTVP